MKRALRELADHTTSGARDAAPSRINRVTSRRRCVQCERGACFERCDASRQALCLLHVYVASVDAPKSRWKMIDRSALHEQKDDVEAAWQRSYDAIAKHLSAAAADQLTKIETSDDPLATILAVPKKRPPPPKISQDTHTRRRKAPPPALSPSTNPVFVRKPTRPSLLWTTRDESPVALPPETPERGERCPMCGSTDTILEESRRGGNVHAHKVEIWGSKDAVDAIDRTTCQSCRHTWTETC